MAFNSAVKKNKFTLTFVSETGRFQNIHDLVSYFRLSSRKSVDTTIQQMIKFDVLSASIIFLLTLFYSFKTRYKKEIYSFLIGQNLPGVTNLSQKTFRETLKYVIPSQNKFFLGESQFYSNTNFIENNLSDFYQKKGIKLEKKPTLFNKSLIFNGKTITNSYYARHNKNFKKEDKFLPSIYHQIEFFKKNKNKTKNISYNLSLLSPYHLTFQSFTAKNFAFSTIKKFEKEGTYLKFSELPLKCDSFFGIFQKKEITSELDGIRHNIFKLPQKIDYGTFCTLQCAEPTTSTISSSLQNKIHIKDLPFVTKVESKNWVRLYKQNKTITKNLFQKSQKNWFYLEQNTSLQAQPIENKFNINQCAGDKIAGDNWIEDQLCRKHQWFSLYKKTLFKKHQDYLKDKKICEKLKIEPILLNELFSVFYNVNNLSKSHALSSTIRDNTNLSDLSNFVKQDISTIKEFSFTSKNWWNLIFKGGFSLNSNFIIENLNSSFLQFTKDSIFRKQKEEILLRKKMRGFSQKIFSLDRKWKEKDYNQYLQLDEFPSKLGSILPSQILTDQFFRRTKNQVSDLSQKKEKTFRIKQKFILRGTKSNLNFSKLDFTKENSPNLKSKSTIFDNSALPKDYAVKNLNFKPKESQETENYSLNKGKKISFLQERTNSYYINKYLKEKVNLPIVDIAEKNQAKAFYLFSKSPKLCFLRNEIRILFSSCKKNSYFLEKEKKTLNLLSNKSLTSLDKFLLSNSNFLQGKNQVLPSETLDTLFEFLPQKICSTNHKVFHNIDENKKISFYKNPTKENTKEISFLTQENNDLLSFNEKLKKKEDLELKHTKKFTQLLQEFWSKKEEVPDKETLDFSMENLVFAEQKLRKNLTGKRRDNGFAFFIKYLSTQPRLMSGYKFPDLDTKEIERLIKCSNSKRILMSNNHFLRKISFFMGDFTKKRSFRLQNHIGPIFPQISEKEIYQQHPIDVYLPNKPFYNAGKKKSYQTKVDKNAILQNVNLGTTSWPQLLQLIASKAQVPLFPESEMLSFSFGEKKSLDEGIKNGDFSLHEKQAFFSFEPLKFISKSLRLENNTEKQSFFVYQIPAVLKPSSVWNPRLQKLQIAKKRNQFKDPASYTSFSKNILSSTNFLTDRKQSFFATGNQVEREQENFFAQRPLSGSLFGLSSNGSLREDYCFATNNLVKNRQTNSTNSCLLKVEPQGKSFSDAKMNFGKENLVFANQQLKKQNKNKNLIRKDFSILPLFSKGIPYSLGKNSLREKNFLINQSSFVPIMPSLNVGSNFIFSEKDFQGDLEKTNKTTQPFVVYSKMYKAYPKAFKRINGINSYSFFDISPFHSPKIPNLQGKNNISLNNCPSDSETFTNTNLTENNLKSNRLLFTKNLLENSKLNIKQKQLSDKCDKQINTLQSVFPFLDTEPFNAAWAKWLSSRYKKPAISYRFQKKVFYLSPNEKRDFFLQQKNRYQKNKWGEVEQQENRIKKGEKDSESLRTFSEQVYLPLTIKRSIRVPNRLKILPSKNPKFSFFTRKPSFLQNKNQGIEEASFANAKQGIQNANFFGKQGSITSNNFRKKGKKSILPYKKLSFISKSVWQQPGISDIFSWKTTKENYSCLLSEQKNSGSVTQISPLSYFLSDTVEKDQSFLSYLKRLDTNCDRLDWQFYQWHPFGSERYAYLPPSQSILNEYFLNSFFKKKIRKRNTVYKYSRHLPILKFHYVKSDRLKNFSIKSSTSKSPSFLEKSKNIQNQISHVKTSETLNRFRKTLNFSYLQNKESFFDILFPKRKRIEVCWEPITIRSWMIVTQYCYAFFLVQSALYVYEKHMKKVLLSFAPLLSGRGILSGMPSFGEKLQDFLGGSTIDKNVLLFKKVPKRFQDIIAIDNKLPQLSEIVWFLRNFGRTTNVNKIQGVLFVGPPGTGKTLLVQAIAGEAEVPVLVLSGSSFADGKKDKKGGQLLKRVFQRARILAPSILFIDEIDTLGESRSHFAQDDRDQKNESSRIIEAISSTEGKIQDRTSFLQNKKKQSVKQVGLLTQFLVEMDGLARQQKSSSLFNNSITFKKPGGILVIGSTNRPKVLDPALTRPGRFDQVFYLSNPGKQRRIDILKVYTKNIGVSTSLPWNYLADRTLGFSPADLSAIVNKSTIRAILSHTIHTIKSIEDGIESLPKLSQNPNKLFSWQENDISNSFLFLESQKYDNGNRILCKSLFTSLSICVKHLNLQNKYMNFTFWVDQPKNDKNSTLKLLHKTATLRKFVNLGKVEENLQQSFSGSNLQEKKGSVKFDYFLNFYDAKMNFGKENFALTKQNSKIGISFLNRLPFYQAGKVLVQILISKDPIILVATLWPKQELSFSNMFKESIHVKEVANCNQLEKRLISGYAGKAAETLLISTLQFSKNNETRVTWQSTLGVEEWKLTNSLASLMISKYYFYSQKGIIQKENLIALSQNSNEILETENFQVLQNIFIKEESTFSQEKQNFELSKGTNHPINTIEENKSPLNPIIWISNLYQQYEITKIFGHIEENNWYQVYLPPFVKDEQNKEWVPLDQYYFGRENLIELVWNTYKNKSTNWSDIYQLDYDFTYQRLVLYYFNKALSLVDQNRELLDLLANLLISFGTIRQHEILRVLSYFKYHNSNFLV